MKKVIVLGLILAFGVAPSLSLALTVEELQDVIRETVDSPSLTAVSDTASSAATTTASSTISAEATSTIAASSTLMVVPESKSNEVTLNIVKKAIRNFLSLFRRK